MRREGERERIFYLLVPFPYGCNGWDWTTLELPGFSLGAGNQALQLLSWVYQQGARLEVDSWNSNQCPNQMPV